MSNNLFYKTLSIIGTLGIVVLSSTQVWTALKKQTDTEAEISKTLLELKKARKETLSEIKTVKSDLIKEIDSLRLKTLNELKANKDNALIDLKEVKKDSLKALKDISGTSKETVWLVLRYGNLGANSLSVVPMKDMAECQFQGAIWESSKNVSRSGSMGFECLEGK